MKRIIIYILALSCALMGCGKPTTDEPAIEITPASESSDKGISSEKSKESPNNNTILESSGSNEWNPTEENYFRYLDGVGNTNGVLERWVEAYRNGEYSQIYIDDPRDGLFQSWRLTCDGSGEYLIERRYFGANVPVEHCGYSRIITEGAIYYTFGEDLTKIDWLPLTIHKGLSERTAISENDDLWVQQATISDEQAIALAAQVVGDKDSNATYQIDERFVYLGQCYYRLKMFIGEDNQVGGFVAVSADGSVLWELDEGWHLIKDKLAVRVLSMME